MSKFWTCFECGTFFEGSSEVDENLIPEDERLAIEERICRECFYAESGTD